MASKRARDAGTGKIVSRKEAKARPKETVTEAVGPSAASLAKRLDLIERVIVEAGGNLATLFKRRQRGLED